MLNTTSGGGNDWNREWSTGDVITAEKLNAITPLIVTVTLDESNENNYISNISYNDVLRAFQMGVPVRVWYGTIMMDGNTETEVDEIVLLRDIDLEAMGHSYEAYSLIKGMEEALLSSYDPDAPLETNPTQSN